jgi:transglutaminase-like putative cysteine protease
MNVFPTINLPPDSAYLAADEIIDWRHPEVLAKAQALAQGMTGRIEIARRCFEFARDQIRHSWDYRQNPVTCKASVVLRHGTGYCYAKSHLLAALLRANGIPAGLCYQRLSVGAGGPPYCLHGLNGVWLEEYGWYRVDPRGNKPGVDAQFTPPVEKLAFAINERLEADLPEIWAEPLPVVVRVLTGYATVAEVAANLPDVELVRRP